MNVFPKAQSTHSRQPKGHRVLQQRHQFDRSHLRLQHLRLQYLRLQYLRFQHLRLQLRPPSNLR